MLGSFSEAEDVVQDAWFRWEKVDGGIDAPAAYLTRIVTRLCLDRLKSARARRETYIGPWLPDPLMGSSDPDETIADDITVTLMLAMERLSPLERAAFLLHDVFYKIGRASCRGRGWQYVEIQVVGVSVTKKIKTRRQL